MVLRVVNASDVPKLDLNPLDSKTLSQSEEILNDVRTNDVDGFLKHAIRLKDLESVEDKFILSHDDLKASYDRISKDNRELIEKTAERIRKFAKCQRDSIKSFETSVVAGVAGQTLEAVSVAGCYAPGGRYPLPSSVLMTAITAKVAGVQTVIVASPRPSDITLAAAYIAKADYFVSVGGPQAIGAMAYGLEKVGLPNCQCIVGPGNKWVTAAKKLVSGVNCCIDMLAGPSECLVLADSTADAEIIAADLIAQAEHDVEALPVLVTNSNELILKVNEQLKLQLNKMPEPNKTVAETACKKGVAVLCISLDECVKVSMKMSPEHFELMVNEELEKEIWTKLENNKSVGGYGGLFVGKASAEVFGDYGVGPNHVLPTSGTAKYTGGLSIFNFLRIRTYLKLDASKTEEMKELIDDVANFARLEGLEGHARAAETRKKLLK